MIRALLLTILLTGSYCAQAAWYSCNHWFGGISQVSGEKVFSVRHLEDDIDAIGEEFGGIEVDFIKGKKRTLAPFNREISFIASADKTEQSVQLEIPSLGIDQHIEGREVHVIAIPREDKLEETWIISLDLKENTHIGGYGYTSIFQVHILLDGKLQKFKSGHRFPRGFSEIWPEVTVDGKNRILRLGNNHSFYAGAVFEQ